MKNFSSLFGKKDNNDYDKYYRDEDDIYGEDDDVTTYGEKGKDGLTLGSGAAPVSLKVVKPKSNADGPAIADYLSSGSTVVLNIESLDRMSAIRLIDFLMGAMNGAPAEPLDPEVDVMPMTMVAGYGLLIIVIVPAVMLLLSFFARKKVPYSIFDK